MRSLSSTFVPTNGEGEFVEQNFRPRLLFAKGYDIMANIQQRIVVRFMNAEIVRCPIRWVSSRAGQTGEKIYGRQPGKKLPRRPTLEQIALHRALKRQKSPAP
jgi:hypothetical protein